MMFSCCHPELSTNAQVTLILKTLCGFSISEIARALLASEASIEKRLGRARRLFLEAGGGRGGRGLTTPNPGGGRRRPGTDDAKS